ncbi:hypothetical protein PVL29_013270 [Vitis rotundifolia]|uniref:Uncharacterized protein n=1 Tax=Vitis rotundifolia TaxID=103349 RepID=A0AA38ZMF4_VITRO|nr:hypothetical protein PVL29_013270 [Vitis rotundifolia]
MREVAAQNRSITISDLTRVVHDDDLGGEILGSNILHIKTNIVTRQSLCQRLMVHFNWLDFSSGSTWPKGDNHSGFKSTSFNTSHWDNSYPTTGTVPSPRILNTSCRGRCNGLSDIQLSL